MRFEYRRVQPLRLPEYRKEKVMKHLSFFSLRVFAFFAVNSCILLILLLFASSVYAEEKPDIVIIYTSNTNGYLLPCNCPHEKTGGIFRRASTIKKYKQAYPDCLVLDSGDFMLLDKDSNQNNFVLQVISKIGYDGIMVGDQELNMGLDFLPQALKKNNVRVIASNLMWCDEEKACYYFGNFYYTKNMGAYRVGVVGIINEKAVKYLEADVKKKLIINDPIEELKNSVELLKKYKKVDIIVVISHCGNDFDKEIAEKVKGIDIILGGHNQMFFEKGEKVKDTIIIQAGQDGNYVGKLKIYMGQDRKIKKFENTMDLMGEKIKDDEDMKKLYEEWKNKKMYLLKK